MHVIVWEFRVAEVNRRVFEEAYGPAGRWVRLFERAEGFKGTELLRDEEDPTRFLTLDRWISAAHFDRFKDDFGALYEATDREFDGLSVSETKIGVFETDWPIPAVVTAKPDSA